MSTTNPKRGVYYGIDFEEYLSWDAISQSSLKRMAESPRHYSRTPEYKESRALKVGSLAHSAVLEPWTLADKYTVMPAFNTDDENKTVSGNQTSSRATKYYKAKAEEFAAINSEKEIVDQQTYDQIGSLVRALSENTHARDLVSEDGKVEVSIIWDDPVTGLPLKGRIDKLLGSAILDLKTTQRLSTFTTSIAKYKYHVQMAHYLAGIRHLTGEPFRDAWLLAVESNRPHCSHVAQLSQETLSHGEMLRRKWLNKVSDCMEKRSWPGPELPTTWHLPEWALEDDEPVIITFANERIEV